jgi:hypothetical protein
VNDCSTTAMNCTLTNGDLVRYVCSFLPMSDRATVSTLSAFLHTTLSTCLQYSISFVNSVNTHSRKEEFIDMFAKLWKNTRRSQLSVDIVSYNFDDDITATLLQGVHTLQIGRCNISKLSSLSNIHTLHLFFCNEVTDVSSLGGVHTLKLTYCAGIIDVSALGCMHTLKLDSCWGITDVSALGCVHTLKLDGCLDCMALLNAPRTFISLCTNMSSETFGSR